MTKYMLAIWALSMAGILSSPGTAIARGGHGRYYKSHSGSYQSKGSSSSYEKPVHVRSYTRKDGTRVEGYNRALPGTKSYGSTPKAYTPKITAPKDSATPKEHKSTYSEGIQRDKSGKIKRSEKAKDDFKNTHPCPSTGKGSGACPGYVIDHINPLKRGGPDSPDNMQWQTEAAAKAKDKVE